MTDTTIELALKRFKFTAESEEDYRKKALLDTKMYCGQGQWDDGIANDRNAQHRPCLVINKLPISVRQVTNNLRQNMPAIRTIPTKDGSEEVAEIFDGMMRHIQDVSQASTAYANANLSQVISGQGFFRVVLQYADDEGFDQEIRITRIKNPLSVYVDPTAIEPDYSDAQYMFITYDIPVEAFKKQYPKKKSISNDELVGKGDELKAWATNTDKDMRLAEYYTVEDGARVTLYQHADGTVSEEKSEEVPVINERVVTKTKIVHRIISAFEVIEETEWVGKYIPIIPVLGEDIDLNGKRCLRGMIRDAADPQRMYNYWASAQTEAIALAPKAPFIIAEGQLEGYKQIWDSANIKSYAYLPYRPVSVGGTVLGAPQRQTAEPPVQAMVQAMLQASDDIKATTGVFDASLGARGNEVSGRAINARKLQADTTNYHYADNFAHSMLHLGRVLIDLIPKIYSSQRIVRIVEEDGSSKMMTINGPSGEKDASGIEKVYDVTAGKYDVTVDVGPSYQTKRQEDADNMTELLKANPELWQVAGDIFAKALDFPDAQRLADRLKKMLPPNLQDDPSGQEEIPQPVMQQLQQYSDLVEKLTQTVNALQQEKNEKLLELESKERIELEKINGQLVLKAMDLEGDANINILKNELQNISTRLNTLNINKPLDASEENVVQL